MERIEREVTRELGRFGTAGGMPELVAAWPRAVGDVVARNAWPARVSRDGTLHVATSSSAWAFELSQLAASVLARLRETLGEGGPSAVRFAPGKLPEPAPAGASPATTTPEPTLEQRARASALVDSVGDEELRALLARAAAAGLARAGSDR